MALIVIEGLDGSGKATQAGRLLAETDSVCYLSGSFGAGFGTTFLEVNRVDKIFQSRDKYLLPNF